MGRNNFACNTFFRVEFFLYNVFILRYDNLTNAVLFVMYYSKYCAVARGFLLMLVLLLVRGLFALRSPTTDELPTVHVGCIFQRARRALNI